MPRRSSASPTCRSGARAAIASRPALQCGRGASAAPTGGDGMDDRRIDQWFAHYSEDHRNQTNQRIHVVAVPLILWSVVALLWCIPVPGTLFRPGLWAALAMFFAWAFYYRASRRLGLGMLEIGRASCRERNACSVDEA